MEDCKIPVQINVRERREHRDKGIQRKKIMGDETMQLGRLPRSDGKVPRHTKQEND